MAFHDPNSVSYRAGLSGFGSDSDSPFTDSEPGTSPAVAAALAGGPLADVLHENTINEQGCVDPRWSDRSDDVSLPIRIPEDIDNTPSDSERSDFPIYDEEDVPTRADCMEELAEWRESIIATHWQEIAIAIRASKRKATSEHLQPPVSFEFTLVDDRLDEPMVEDLMERLADRGWSVGRGSQEGKPDVIITLI